LAYLHQRKGREKKRATASHLKRFYGEEIGAEIRFASLTGSNCVDSPGKNEPDAEGEGTGEAEANLQDCSRSLKEGYEPATFHAEENAEALDSELGIQLRRPSTRYPPTEWVRAMSSLGPHSIRDRAVTVHVDHTLLRE
jgi:hypothetical protein